MILLNPYFYANKQGIPRLEAETVTLTTDAATFNFSNHKYLNLPYSGLILFKLPSFTAPSTAFSAPPTTLLTPFTASCPTLLLAKQTLKENIRATKIPMLTNNFLYIKLSSYFKF